MELIYQIPEWLLMVSMAPLLLAAGEIGFRGGYAHRERHDAQSRATFGTIQAGVLGLLALLLGFLFSMSVARYELRRSMIVDEANAIGTAMLRSDFLDGDGPKALREALRQYVEIRIEMANLVQNGSEERSALKRLSPLQDALWQRGAALVRERPTSQGAALLVQSLNDVFDAQGRTRAAYLNHIPETGIFMVFMVALIAMGMVGHGNGLVGARLFRSQFLFSFLITLVLLLIMDLDRPNRGWIQVSQGAMLEVAGSLGKAGP